MDHGGILTYENCVSSRKRKRFRFPVALHSVVETVDTLIFHTGVRTIPITVPKNPNDGAIAINSVIQEQPFSR